MSSVEIVRSLNQLRSLRDGWDDLSARSRSPLLDYDWFVSCAETLHREQDLRVAVACDHGAPAAIAPLAREHTGLGARLGLLGATVLHEPGGWVFGSHRALRELIGRVADLKYPLVLKRISSESPVCRLLPDLNKARAISFVRVSAPSLGVPTSGEWNDYYHRLSSRITSNLPRLRRKATRAIGPVDAQESYPAPADVDDVLQAFAAIEQSGWKGRKGSSLAQRVDLRTFFRAYCRRAAERKRLRLMSLTFGADIAAMELSVEAYNRIWQLKIAYHDAVAHYYPGLQLTEASIRSGFARHLEAYEFLGVAEPWEQRWRPEERGCRLLVSYPLSARGMVGACRDFAGAMMRRARSQAAGLMIPSDVWP